MKRLFDSHCHIYASQYDDCKEELIAQIEDSQIRYLVDIGTDLLTCRQVLEDVRKYDFCYGAVGYYPQDTGSCPADAADPLKAGLSANNAPVLSEEILSEIISMYKENDKIVAIGEIGLDYHDPEYYPDPETQKYWFIRQLQEAVKIAAPVCIHSRDADRDCFDILKEHALGKTPVLLHCYSGSAELAKEYVKLGAMISLAGPLTFKNARHSVEVAREIPLDKLLIETDAPYMAPVPKRGQTNKPFYVEYTAGKLAEIKGISCEEAADATLKNACRFYGIENI